LVCLFYSYPCKGHRNVKYSFASEPDGYQTLWSVIAKISKSDHTNEHALHHADALKWLATANRMLTLTDKSLAWALARSRELLNDDVKRAFETLDREFARIVHRNTLVNVIEKAVMLEYQVSIFAISRSLMPRDLPNRWDGQMLISLVVSGGSFLKIIYDSFAQDWMIRRFWREACSVRIRRMPAQATRCSRIRKLMRHILCRREWQLPEEELDFRTFRVYLSWTGFWVGNFLLILFGIHCLAKFVMAFECKDSLWNIRVPGITEEGHKLMDWKGCMDLDLILGQ